MSGEKREPPKVELLPVDVTTPVFKNFFIRNVTCNGAEKAILIRGIPEMHIKNILLENMLLQTNQGVDIQEASGITFKAVTVLSKLTNPVIYLLNSDAITFEQFNYSNGAALLIQTQGERTNHINFNQVDASKAQKKVTADFGSKETDIIWKN